MDSNQLNSLILAIDSITAVVTSGTGGLSNKVPYTGAILPVDLNSQNLTTTGTVTALIQTASIFPATNVDLVISTRNGAAGTSISLRAGTSPIAVLTVSNQALMVANGVNISFATATGTKFGTSVTQKMGWWNATPVVQQTTAIVGAAFAANTSGIGDGTATYGGYTGGQIVAALRLYGILN